MFKTLFIVIVSVIVSAVTTTSLLYRYTKPAESMSPRFSQTEKAVAAPDPVSMVKQMAETVKEKLLPQSPQPQTKVAIEKMVLIETEEVVVTVEQKREFDHELMLNDMSSVSEKLSRFNDFLHSEVEKMKNKGSNKSQS